MKRVAIARRLDEAQVLEPREQDRQRDREFEPRERCAGAEMNAGEASRIAA
jgi:hypothetical protein